MTFYEELDRDNAVLKVMRYDNRGKCWAVEVVNRWYLDKTKDKPEWFAYRGLGETMCQAISDLRWETAGLEHKFSTLEEILAEER